MAPHDFYKAYIGRKRYFCGRLLLAKSQMMQMCIEQPGKDPMDYQFYKETPVDYCICFRVPSSWVRERITPILIEDKVVEHYAPKMYPNGVKLLGIVPKPIRLSKY
jgi:hypothetical protein